jgi:hypothetical protein
MAPRSLIIEIGEQIPATAQSINPASQKITRCLGDHTATPCWDAV